MYAKFFRKALMYQYDHFDQNLVNQRVNQFRHQTERYLAGELSEAEYLPLRLQNGIYVQRYAPMLRVAIPYGMLNSTQLLKLADISEQYDKGYGHISTRQNIQFNWPKLEQCPDILAELATVEMHAIQTSGNCIRNTTTDEYAGVIKDEVADPRPYCEIIRQWSTLHPEFAFLPRKFKIAVNAIINDDRSATQAHDIGVYIVNNSNGEIGFKITAGGGLGRTPILAETLTEFLPEKHLLSYLQAIVRVYNQFGRRDNKFKARIKILLKAKGVEAFRAMVEAEWKSIKNENQLSKEEVQRVKQFFSEPNYKVLEDSPESLIKQKKENKAFSRWLERNVKEHKKSGYAIVNLTLKQVGTAPGDVSSKQMRDIAHLADEYSFSEIRTTHQQNMVLADVEQQALFELWQKAKACGLATPNLGMLTDMICCPGGDFCALANAKSIPLAEDLQSRFDDLDYLHDIGDLDLNISGCMNACGHHHVGNIGILGVDKKGQEFYQVSLGGNAGKTTRLGKILGPSFSRESVSAAIETIIEHYIEHRLEDEHFVECYQRLGHNSFKEAVYGKAN